MSFRPDETLSAIAFNQAIYWLVCGLIYNLWESELVFEDVNLMQPLDKYFPSYKQYDIWKEALPKIYLMGKDEKLPPNMDTLVEIIDNYKNLYQQIGSI